MVRPLSAHTKQAVQGCFLYPVRDLALEYPYVERAVLSTLSRNYRRRTR
jgi:hypothetical protein